MRKELSTKAAMRRLGVSDKTFRELVHGGWIAPVRAGGQGKAMTFDPAHLDDYAQNADLAEVLAAAVHVKASGHDAALRDFANHVRHFFGAGNARRNTAVAKFRRLYPGLSYWRGRVGVPTVSERVRSNHITRGPDGMLILDVSAPTLTLCRRVCAKMQRHEVPYLIGLVVADGYTRQRHTAQSEYVGRHFWDAIGRYIRSGNIGPEFDGDLRLLVAAKDGKPVDYETVRNFVRKYSNQLALPPGMEKAVCESIRDTRRPYKLPNAAKVADLIGLSRSRSYALCGAVRRHVPRADLGALLSIKAGEPAEADPINEYDDMLKRTQQRFADQYGEAAQYKG